MTLSALSLLFPTYVSCHMTLCVEMLCSVLCRFVESTRSHTLLPFLPIDGSQCINQTVF